MELKRVVVTGLGAVTPIGNDVPTFWENLLKGVSGATRITYFDPTLYKSAIACEVKDFQVENYFDRKDARKFDKFVHYAVAAAQEAL